MSKYHARPVVLDGYKFDSMAEANRYVELKRLQEMHAIACLEVHPRYLLQTGFTHKGGRERAIFYEPDFQYMENGALVVEDVKGMETPVYKLKRKLLLYQHPDMDFRVIRA